MRRVRPYLVGLAIAIISIFYTLPETFPELIDIEVLSYEVDPSAGNLRMYYKDAEGNPIRSFAKLRGLLAEEGQELSFAMNGGMYMEDRTPLGYYVEEGIQLKRMNRVQEAHGNFYLQPNGIFYLLPDGTAEVCPTTDYPVGDSVSFATQSGPMLLVDGNIHPGLTPGSSNLNIRNGVGILPDGNVLFAMSEEMVNFYDFATFFKQRGCRYALYLDGFVSRTYLPSQDQDYLGGNFGVIIAEVIDK